MTSIFGQKVLLPKSKFIAIRLMEVFRNIENNIIQQPVMAKGPYMELVTP